MTRTWIAVAAAMLLASQACAEPRPRIAIIIDDLGYQLAAGRRAIQLPGPVSFAVLPQTPYATRLAQLANERRREVLLHLPLEAVDGSGRTEPGGIGLDMTRATFHATFAADIESVPFAIGVSSHRGSLLTRHPGHMAWLMDEIRARGSLVFVDSYTTERSVALRLAREAGIAATRRDVFLDHERSTEGVSLQLRRLKNKARHNGSAVAIGHPFPETLDVLERELPRLEAEGFELVTISELVRDERNRI